MHERHHLRGSFRLQQSLHQPITVCFSPAHGTWAFPAHFRPEAEGQNGEGSSLWVFLGYFYGALRARMPILPISPPGFLYSVPVLCGDPRRQDGRGEGDQKILIFLYLGM